MLSYVVPEPKALRLLFAYCQQLALNNVVFEAKVIRAVAKELLERGRLRYSAIRPIWDRVYGLRQLRPKTCR
jgi:hypothetical protein